MKLLIDANILLDVLQNREPYYYDSSMIWKLCETKKVIGCVSTLSFANLVYVMRKELSAEQIEKILRELAIIFDFVELSTADLTRASKMRWGDFEDAIQCATAERNNVNYIITRNVKDFKKSSIMALTPTEFIARW